MRISDWSSDVCSSDLMERIGERQGLIRELALIGGVSDAVIRGLVKAGAFEAVEVSVDTPFPMPNPDHAPPLLSDKQGAAADQFIAAVRERRSEEHTSELQSLMSHSYAVFCFKKKNTNMQPAHT